MKHKHAELIKAWADGAEIQIFSKLFNEWRFISEPDWNKDYQYRIKPEPKPDVIRLVIANNENGDEKIKLIFDGETGDLKGAEVKR